MDGMSCLQTINNVDKTWYLWMGWPVCKQYITRLELCTLDVLCINNKSRG
jgi:hypothetical protein